MIKELKINNLVFFVNLGVEPWEKVIKRKIIINISFRTKYILDYVKIKEFLRDNLQNNRYDYIEEITEQVFSMLTMQFKAESLSLEIIKVNALPRVNASLSIQSS